MKSELAKARDKWIDGGEGKRCCSGIAQGQCLQNRIEAAFIAGWDVCESEIQAENERLKVYAQHLPSCNMLAPIQLVSKNGKIGCDCGFDQALSKDANATTDK